MSDIQKDRNGNLWAIGYAATAKQAEVQGLRVPKAQSAVMLSKSDLARLVADMIAAKLLSEDQ